MAGDPRHSGISAVWQTLRMDRRIEKRYKIVRVLEDGERIPVSSLEDADEARRLIASLNEYWPGNYSMIPLDADSQAQ
jgi:hypothetical protein